MKTMVRILEEVKTIENWNGTDFIMPITFGPHANYTLNKNMVIGKVMGSSPVGCVSCLSIQKKKKEEEEKKRRRIIDFQKICEENQ
jgi:hypothetical protein